MCRVELQSYTVVLGVKAPRCNDHQESVDKDRYCGHQQAHVVIIVGGLPQGLHFLKDFRKLS